MYNLADMTLTEKIKQKAIQLGFDLVGVTDGSLIGTGHEGYYQKWLKAGFAAEMNYLHKNLDKRFDPGKLLPNAKSIIVTGLNYKPPLSKASDTNEPAGRVAAYAQYEDYHTFIKGMLRKLADFITDSAETKPAFKFCVDSVPLAERSLAEKAGLGFIGKNRMLINPALGPQILLGEIITDLKLENDKPNRHSDYSQESHPCYGCDRCIKACPTGALQSDGNFNANKCISYLTIEHAGDIPEELSEKIGGRIFGCDRCVIVCPYYENAPVYKNKEFKFYPERAGLNLNDILKMNEDEFKERFSDSPIYRTGLEKLKRNAKICLENMS